MRHRGRGPVRAASAALAAVTVVGALLTGCTGGSDGSPGSDATPTQSPTTAYPTGAPTGTVYTDPGTELPLAGSATVSWQPRQGVTGTVRLSVDKIERTTFKKSFQDWKVDKRTHTYRPFFVHARVTNVGTTPLGGVAVPLYGESAADQLVEAAVFKETFKPCHSSVLPKRFRPGATASVCLVYLVPAKGSLVGAAFRPTQDFSAIVWRGAVVDLATQGKGRKKTS
jgi:hypothetical protein